MHPALVADHAEMLVDAEHDQDQLGHDARTPAPTIALAITDSSTMKPPNGLIAISGEMR